MSTPTTIPPQTVQNWLNQAETELSTSIWPQIEATYYAVFERVLHAFIKHRVGEEHFSSVTGYGHDDMGRETVDKVFADALQAEAALVRVQIVSGTHALAVALNGCLQAGDSMLSVTGSPYDTLEEVIGIRGDDPNSLKAKGVTYQECWLEPDAEWTNEHKQSIAASKMVYIQRSRGYSLRKALSIDEIESLTRRVKAIHPDVIVMVDNCYGEFTELNEPTGVGADIMAGSLIKNPGGGIVPAGGYVAGRKDLVKTCASALTCPGIGTKGGYTFDLSRIILQGLFLAPGVVKETLKGMHLAARLFELAGFDLTPHWQEPRSDIIQVIHLKSPENLVAFCKTLQSLSPVNSHLTPEPCEIPGYADEVVMAGGTFIEGSTIELSADGPLRKPYTVFLQGGLTYAHTRYALSRILQQLNLN